MLVSRKYNDAWRKYRVGGKGTEESADESVNSSEEETEESSTEEEAKTAGRAGEAGMMLTVTAGELEESDVEDKPGVAAADGGTTSDATSEDAAEAGAGG